MRVLVIEHESSTARVLQKGLEANHFAVDVAPDGEEGLQLATEIDYDALILDADLPRLDGMAVLKRLRKSGLQSRILMITREATSTAVVRALQTGADDCMANPFAFEELLARLNALLRRPHELLDKLSVDDLQLDRMRHAVTRAGKLIRLTPREYAILEYLMRNAGRVVTRSMMVEHVWNLAYDGLTNIVNVYVNSLRAKLDKGFARRLIHTARGAGYVLGDLSNGETDLELTGDPNLRRRKNVPQASPAASEERTSGTKEVPGQQTRNLPHSA